MRPKDYATSQGEPFYKPGGGKIARIYETKGKQKVDESLINISRFFTIVSLASDVQPLATA